VASPDCSIECHRLDRAVLAIMKSSTDFQCLSIDRAMAYIGTEAGVLSLMPALRQSLITDLARIEQSLAASDLSQAQDGLHQLRGFIPGWPPNLRSCKPKSTGT
jgi:hypothetical protein